MAQKVSVTFACDYDQKPIPKGQHHARRFSLDGRDYEIDLCAKHSQKFDDVVSRYAQQRAPRVGPGQPDQAADHSPPAAQCRDTDLGQGKRD